MDFIITKNGLADLNVFFYKPGMTNIHRPMISMLKIDSSKQVEPFFHIGFKQNMGYSSSNQITSGVMVFEVLEGYPLQSLLFTNNDTKGKAYIQSVEELEAMDLYVIQKENKDPYGDFILRNVKFVNTQYNQSVNEFARRIVATFICEGKVSFRIPFFFNHFKSDIYSSHIIRSKEEIDNIKKDISNTWDKLPDERKDECIEALGLPVVDRKDIFEILRIIDDCWKEIYLDKITGVKLQKQSALYRMREFIRVYYVYANQLNYHIAKARGDLEFLKFIDLEKHADLIENGIKEELLNRGVNIGKQK